MDALILKIITSEMNTPEGETAIYLKVEMPELELESNAHAPQSFRIRGTGIRIP